MRRTSGGARHDTRTRPSSRALTSSSDVVAVVRRYFATVANLDSTEGDLLQLLADDVQVVEHPNAITPSGAARDLTGVVEGFRAGKALLREQSFEVHEVLVEGDRAAVRATWHGVIGVSAGPYRRGQQLMAHIAALLTVRNGRIVHHETFDCFDTVATR